MIVDPSNKGISLTYRLYLPVHSPVCAPGVFHNPIWRPVLFCTITHSQDCMIHALCCVLTLGTKQTTMMFLDY